MSAQLPLSRSSTVKTERLLTEELRAVYRGVGDKERALLDELAHSGHPHEAYVLAEIFHYFPGTRLIEDERGDPVAQNLFDGESYR